MANTDVPECVMEEREPMKRPASNEARALDGLRVDLDTLRQWASEATIDGQGAWWRPYERAEEEPGRNDPCPCGSGRKNKKCHLCAVDRGEVTIMELAVGHRVARAHQSRR